MKGKRVNEMSCEELELEEWKAENQDERKAEKIYAEKLSKKCKP